jgi:hypothetical protein
VKRAPLAAAAAMLAVLAAGCSSAAAAPARTQAASPVAVSGKPGHLLVGAADTSAQAFTASTGVQPDIVEHYTRINQPFIANWAGSAEPLIQIEPRHATMSQVAAGRYDTWLRSYAEAAAAYGKPVILGFGPEMNGSWYTWGYKHASPADYIAAWRHVVNVFRDAGATNVEWMWTVNIVTTGVSSPAMWWPGSKWVDLVGIDGYYESPNQTFASIIKPTVKDVRKSWGGPVLLSETAVAPGAGQAAKIPGLFAGAKDDGLIGLIWFDLEGNADWVLRDPAALAAFRAAAKEYR